jgi:CBS domain-containing protein
VPTCQLTDRLGDVQDRVQKAGWDVCVVIGGNSVVLGLLRGDVFTAAPETLIEHVMESGPSTIRPHLTVESMLENMRKQRVEHFVVTTLDGRLVGVLYRKDIEQA